ncbi:MAG: putative quinol monooxygenase [Bacillota bacterium]|nr:putative quinol monooxygenase [Bacillota bacterium]
MHIVHVFISVKEEYILEFREATIENAQRSLAESGIVRFDVLQQQDEPSEFMLEEIYISSDDQLKHRETEHFKKWKEAIAQMIAKPYTFKKYNNIHPDMIMK